MSSTTRRRRTGLRRTAGRLGRWAAAVGAAVAIAVSTPTTGSAQAPDEEWRTLATAHFRVTFPERLEPLARRAADRAEWAYDALGDALIDPPDGLIDVLVTDHTDTATGFAQVVPSNRVTVFARPGVDRLSLAYFDDWMELIILHELAHIVHLDHARNPIGRLARAVFGRVGTKWPFFPSLGTPRWLIEGLATWYESRLTGSGRVRGTFQEMQVRTALIEGRFEDIGQASGVSPLWPGGNRPFVYGARFFEHLLAKHGEDRMAAFVEAIAGQWVPYRLDSAGRDAFGLSLSEEWTAWEADLEMAYRDLDDRLGQLGPIIEPERLTTDARWGFHPTVSPDGRSLVYVGADGRSDIQLRIDDPAGGSARQLTRTNGLSTFSWMPDGRLLVAQMELDGPYRSYGDLYITAASGRQARLTYQARLTDPSVAPDGRSALAVQQGDGTNGLVWVDLATGVVTPLVAPDPDVHWAFPRISPDGRLVAATRWEPHAYSDVVILDAASGEPLHRVTRDRAIDLAPSWGPDSRWLVWSSDRTGIANIVGSVVDPTTGHASAPVMLTNLRTGAAFPSIDPTGAWLYFSGYHVDGWEVERTPFPDDSAPAAPTPRSSLRPAPKISTDPRRISPQCARGTVRCRPDVAADLLGGRLPRADRLPLAGDRRRHRPAPEEGARIRVRRADVRPGPRRAPRLQSARPGVHGRRQGGDRRRVRVCGSGQPRALVHGNPDLRRRGAVHRRHGSRHALHPRAGAGGRRCRHVPRAALAARPSS